MNYIFDNTYVMNSQICRDVGDLYAIFDKRTGMFLGYRAIAKKLINDQEICSMSYPRDPEDLTNDEILNAKTKEVI